MSGWIVVAVAVGYICLLFAIAYYGDRIRRSMPKVGGRPYIYALSLGVYCTSWTFYGSVGSASFRGLDFLAIYIGPLIFYLFAHPLIRRVIRVAKTERITSIADFVSARYGKNQAVAAVVTLIACVGMVPYIALQLKAISFSVGTVSAHYDLGVGMPASVGYLSDTTFYIALALAAFACLFGTRHIDATEHQEGMMLAIATESMIKLVAFLAVGIYVVFVLFDGPGDLMQRVEDVGIAQTVFSQHLSGGTWITTTVISFFAILLLPRMFHVTVVENNAPEELKTARWLFPAYLVAINIFVMPIAMAGLIRLAPGIDADTFVLRLPLEAGADLIGLLAFVGGLSAATAMVIVACVALAIMIGNEVIVPALLRRGDMQPEDMGASLLVVRRVAIFVILLAAYLYYRMLSDKSALADIGLIAFAGIAQIAPAFIGGLLWRRATARGAIAGLTTGFIVWLYTLLLPTMVASGILPKSFLTDGPFGFWLLRPQAFFSIGFDPLQHGVFWSLLLNTSAFIFVSLTRSPEPIERVQASIFVPLDRTPTPAIRLWRTAVTVDDLRTTVASYLGDERTRTAFDEHFRDRKQAAVAAGPADIQLLRYCEQLLASAIGAASSRLVLSLLVKRRDPSAKAAMKLLDDASTALQHNRDLLQTAIDQVAQGISVFDKDLRLVFWNRQFSSMLQLTPELAQAGTSLNTILKDRIDKGEFGVGNPDRLSRLWVQRLAECRESFQQRIASTGRVLDVTANPMPDGGVVATWTDITDRVTAADALQRANETLERRVRERTEQLTNLNEELRRAKSEADAANLGKTKFLAAAGHDIAQPLNAARLYVTSLVERTAGTEIEGLARHIDGSLDSVEEIIGALLDMSRLDAGQMKPEFSIFRLDEFLRQVAVEFGPLAREKSLQLHVMPSSLTVRSDRRLLRRLVQNLVSNAIKYTAEGKVLVGCRRHGGRVQIEVWDTGQGIPQSKRNVIFEEFQRLDEGARVARGLGLGLSIVERIARILGHRIVVESEPGRGSCFRIDLAMAAAIPAEQPMAGPPQPVSALSGMSILCIDNEPQILDGMRAMLTGWGCHVLTASEPREAARLIQEAGTTPDAMLIDFHLDDGNGIDAVVSLRWRFGHDIPAILVTADRTVEVREQARDKNIAMLGKPLKPAQLRAVLSQWRAQRPAEAETA